MIHRHSARLLLLALATLAAPALFGQNNRLDGIWVAPKTTAHGPSFFLYTFRVAGDTFTGHIGEEGKTPGDAMVNCKIENGQFSFALPKEQAPGGLIEETFTGNIKDARHLDLIEETRISGSKLIHKPGTNFAPNSLDGDWVEEGRPGPENSKPLYRLHVEGGKLTGEVLDHEIHDYDITHTIGPAITLPFTEGSVHGNEFSFSYINKAHDPMTRTGTLVGDRLVTTTDVKHKYHLFRVADAPAESAGNSSSAK